jgi:hypothetical protein
MARFKCIIQQNPSQFGENRLGLIGHVGTGVADIHFTNVSGQWTRHSEGKGSNRVLPIGSRK